ncbi:Uncharacterized protein APZ42_032233 [Daphnia magna]|uniref:Uncharacterized protein n=1 Tax=Daphnia magna TaxID=35525 RepID=A0A164M626_9CRUS|nr:Uncharacterized protein APZ42_032233 [Daphnia magna]
MRAPSRQKKNTRQRIAHATPVAPKTKRNDASPPLTTTVTQSTPITKTRTTTSSSLALCPTPVNHTRLYPDFNAEVEDVELLTEEALEQPGPVLTVRKNRNIHVKGQPPTRVSERNRNKAPHPLVPETIEPIEPTLINDIYLKLENDPEAADEDDDFSSVKSHNDLEVEQDLERIRERVKADLRWTEKKTVDTNPHRPTIAHLNPYETLHKCLRETGASREDAAAGAKAALALTKTACGATGFPVVDKVEKEVNCSAVMNQSYYNSQKLLQNQQQQTIALLAQVPAFNGMGATKFEDWKQHFERVIDTDEFKEGRKIKL